MESSSTSSSLSPDNPENHRNINRPSQRPLQPQPQPQAQAQVQAQADSSAGKVHEQGTASTGAETQKKKHHKMRPYSACIPCRNRKVKCDRLTPCDTCTSRGIASECQYMANDEDRHHMAQAEVIAGLRAKVRELRGRVASADEEERRRLEGMRARALYHGSGKVGLGDGEDEQAMRVVYEAIRGAEWTVAWRLVEMVREGRDLGDVARWAKGFPGEA